MFTSRVSQIDKIFAEVCDYRWINPLDDSSFCVIYGAGGYGCDVAKVLRQRGITVLGFIDKRGPACIEGFECLNPSGDLKKWVVLQPLVLVGLHNYLVDLEPVRELLKSIGFSKVYLPVEYHKAIESTLGVRYWLGQQDIYRDSLAELGAVYKMLADDKSREVFLSTLRYRALHKPEACPERDSEAVYFPGDIPRWNDSVSWVDGGAFDGDSIRAFPLDRYSAGNIYSFEPDLSNFQKLQGTIESFRKASPASRLQTWPCALGNYNGFIGFTGGAGLASSTGSAGSGQCPLVRLDDVLHNSEVNLIKLDVEGAELDALNGAQRIIEHQHPGLAVCVYHLPEHLWTIPLMIAEKYSDYGYYLRCYSENSFDLVLYAVPT